MTSQVLLYKFTSGRRIWIFGVAWQWCTYATQILTTPVDNDILLELKTLSLFEEATVQDFKVEQDSGLAEGLHVPIHILHVAANVSEVVDCTSRIVSNSKVKNLLFEPPSLP